GAQVVHRVVASPVAELQLVGPAAVGQGDHLVAQADAKDGVEPPQLPHQADHRLHVLRVPGAVGEEHPVGGHAHDDGGGGVVGHHGDVAAPGVQGADDVELDAAVHRHHIVPVVGGPGVPALAAAHPGDLVP